MKALPLERRCQHPLEKVHFICKNESCGEFDIPPDYIPSTRYVLDTPLPPRMRLCPAHKGKVDKWRRGGVETPTDTHELRCKVCLHPDSKRLQKLWLEWVLTSDQVIAELNSDPERYISRMSWYRHIEYFGLVDKKSAKVNTKRALVIAAEKGFGAGGHSARTALAALQLLAKERGDVEEVKHTVTGVIGTVDLTKLTDRQLAEMADRLAAELRKGEGGGGAAAAREQVALTSDTGGVTIDLPKSSVKVRDTE